jgi:hypothetical protein
MQNPQHNSTPNTDSDAMLILAEEGLERECSNDSDNYSAHRKDVQKFQQWLDSKLIPAKDFYPSPSRQLATGTTSSPTSISAFFARADKKLGINRTDSEGSTIGNPEPDEAAKNFHAGVARYLGLTQ